MNMPFCWCVIKNASALQLVGRLVSHASFMHVVHLLNIVDPVDWIVYFLPARWKLCKKRGKEGKINSGNGGTEVRTVRKQKPSRDPLPVSASPSSHTGQVTQQLL